MEKIRVVIADDERPARLFLSNLLQSFEDIAVIGEAEDGSEAIRLIEEMQPDLALLDLQMPELTGLEVVQLLKKEQLPLVAFVTAYDEYAVRAFELNAIDYLLKPVERTRLRETLNRVAERLERGYSRNDEARNLEGALQEYAVGSQPPYLERIPVRHREEILIIPVINIASIIADGELLQITTIENRRYTINYRLKDLAARLNPTHFLRLGRGAVVNIELITRITPMPGGTFLVTLNNNQQLKVSRLQSRSLRERLLKL